MSQSTMRQTVEQFLAWSEGQDRLFELIDGETQEKMVGYTASKIAGLILTYLNLYLFTHPIGSATGADGAYIFANDTLMIPDAAFILNQRLPSNLTGAVSVPPDLAVEVKSPSDSYRELRRKAEKYIALGTKVVWLVFPETEQIEVYIGTDKELILGIHDTLSGGDLLPGFSLPLRDVF